MIHGFAMGDYSFADSSEFENWSDRDDMPVSARNYAYDVFTFEHTEFLEENILDELNWYFRDDNGYTVEGNVAVAVDTVSAWPFMVRRKVVLIKKFHGSDGWEEKPFMVPSPVEHASLELLNDVLAITDCD